MLVFDVTSKGKPVRNSVADVMEPDDNRWHVSIIPFEDGRSVTVGDFTVNRGLLIIFDSPHDSFAFQLAPVEYPKRAGSLKLLRGKIHDSCTRPVYDLMHAIRFHPTTLDDDFVARYDVRPVEIVNVGPEGQA